MKPAIFCDLDGTLANLDHRLHYIKRKPKDWKTFSSLCAHDTLIEPTAYLLELISSSLMLSDPIVIIATCRTDATRSQTETWLKQHEVSYGRMLMRKDGDHRPDPIVKKEMLETARADGLNVMFAIEDRPDVVRMWRENGVFCFMPDDGGWHKEIEVEGASKFVNWLKKKDVLVDGWLELFEHDHLNLDHRKSATADTE